MEVSYVSSKVYSVATIMLIVHTALLSTAIETMLYFLSTIRRIEHHQM